jgi:amino acid adenylation domain-containing protein
MDSTLTRALPGTGQPSRPADEAALQLPFDFAPTPNTRHAAACHPFDVGVPSIRGVAPDVLLATVFGIALARYNAQAMIPLLAARLLASGQVLSRTPLRLQIGPDTTCQELLGQVGSQVSSVAAPAGSVWGAGGARAAISFIESTPGQVPDVLSVLAQSNSDLASADLQWVITGSGERRRGALAYNASLFKASSVARLAGHIEVLLGQFVAHLDQPVARVPMLGRHERDWLAQVGNGRRCALPGEFVHQSFEAHCAAAPDAIAVRWREHSLSYAELNRRANQLAHHLAAQGVGANHPVIVCVEPGVEIAVALLAVLKAGAIYVPLDPAYPAARIRAILDDTNPKLVLSLSALIAKLGLGSSATFAFDTNADVLDGLPGGNPNLPVDPAQTATIYYTSGTTGKPKGVMASQGNLRAYIRLAQERYAFTARDVMPAIARFSFSISMFELMSPLVAGGTLIVLDRDHVLDLDRLVRTLAEVTFFHAGPSLLKNVLAHIRKHYRNFRAFSGVRHASSGGDMIAPEILESLKEIFANAEVFVIYGCSEVSCMGCTYPVPRDATVTRTYVGRPFDNVVVRVLDTALNQVPAGIVGEIHFAGAGVVKGYLNRPELGAEKFVEIDGLRFYRTGDMGRLSDDGWLEILGRNDFQINVRGMRIELGEVEVNLRRAPGVRDGVVVAKLAASGDKALVAYFVADPAGAGRARAVDRIAAIRRHMVENLPDYMVPASYVELETLPLNHNMKVDRRALPEPELAHQRVAGDPRLRQPETPTEQQLAALWKRLLGVVQVGLDDNFFELGGQSLNAMEFIAAAKQALGADLDGMEVLRESLEVLAAMCDRRLGRLVADPAQRARAAATGERIEIFHFGADRSLYGALHTPARDASGTAVLVCAPIGQEHVRTHFILNRLGRQLAAQGAPVLRFDYFGCSDSLGDSVDASCERWQRDIVDAYHELRHRSGGHRIVGVGARLGATLLVHAAQRVDLAGIVLWDPIGEGTQYYAEMAEMHRRYVRGTQHLRLGRSPRRLHGAEELLGTTYSSAALEQLRSLALASKLSACAQPLKWLITSQPQDQLALFGSIARKHAGSRIEQLEFDCHWHEVAQMAEVLPDVGISRALATMVREAA